MTASKRDASRGAFPLLSLPYELRHQVFSVAFGSCLYNSGCDHHHRCPASGSSVPVVTTGFRSTKGSPTFATHGFEHPPYERKDEIEKTEKQRGPAALVATCRFINQETTPYLYHTIEMPSLLKLRRFLESQSKEKLSLVHHIHFSSTGGYNIRALGFDLSDLHSCVLEHIYKHMPNVLCFWLDAQVRDIKGLSGLLACWEIELHDGGQWQRLRHEILETYKDMQRQHHLTG